MFTGANNAFDCFQTYEQLYQWLFKFSEYPEDNTTRKTSSRNLNAETETNTGEKTPNFRGTERHATIKIPKESAEHLNLILEHQQCSPLSRNPESVTPNPQEEEYEDSICECFCLEIFWSVGFTEFCSRILDMQLTHSSKKGTPAWHRKRPVTEGRIVRAMRKMGEHTRKKRRKLKKNWQSRRISIWNYQVRIRWNPVS